MENEALQKEQELKLKKTSFKNSFKDFLYSTLDIRHDTDISGTISGIKKDIIFKGHNVWILIVSIFIASIGLNVNSTAVVIGAMLISPLMGPILGIGLSVGTNDWETLILSLKNLAIMVFLSLLTSTIYFSITPLTDIQSEILARTRPTILDVLIAIFGGIAGVIAGSRKEKTNVIPGVAIATALMPPLCTAGFGLASGSWSFFFGAFYLFFLNSVFISLSTLIGVKYLRFPQKVIINKSKEKKIRIYMIIFIVITILPSTYLFWQVIKETRFKAAAEIFVKNEIQFHGTEIIDKSYEYTDTLSKINIYIVGESLSKNKINFLNEKVIDYGLKRKGSFWNTGEIGITDNTLIKIHQDNKSLAEIDSKLSKFQNTIKVGILEDLYKKNEEELLSKNQKIEFLENEIIKLKTNDTIPFDQLSKEIKIRYTQINKLSYAKSIETDFKNKRDTIPNVLINWKKNTTNNQKIMESKEIKEWIKIRLNLDTVRIIKY